MHRGILTNVSFGYIFITGDKYLSTTRGKGADKNKANMTHTQSIKFRSFSFYSGRTGSEFKRSFISGRNEGAPEAFIRAVDTVSRYQNWWRTPKYKRSYSTKGE